MHVDVGVNLCSADTLMTEHFLDGSKVGSALEECRGERVAQGVGTDVLLYSGFVGEPLYHRVYHDTG